MNNITTFVYHLGAPYTDGNQLVKSLFKDIKTLTGQGVLLRRAWTWRKFVADRIKELGGDPAPFDMQEEIYDHIIRKSGADRVILSNPNFMGMLSWILYKGQFYQNAAERTRGLRNLMPDNPCEFFLGISNPASFVPAVFRGQKEKDYEQFISGANLEDIRWSDVIGDIQEANPDCPITVWCNEDTPIVWPSVLQEITQLDPPPRFAGEQDVIMDILTEEGAKNLLHYLEERPDLTEIQHRRVRAIFLEKFYDDTAVEDEIDLPGWTGETVDTLSGIYEEDVEQIAHMPGVDFISL
jgi:hypothetical protein